jgi:hypothetical protein
MTSGVKPSVIILIVIVFMIKSNSEWCYAEHHYADCHNVVRFHDKKVMVSGVMLSVIMPIVTMLRVFMIKK